MYINYFIALYYIILYNIKSLYILYVYYIIDIILYIYIHIYIYMCVCHF